MSNEAVGWVWRNSPYSGAQLLVHLAIADVVNDLHQYEFWMSTDGLARKAKVSRSTVVATLSDMCARGLLECLEAGGVNRKPSRYRFTSAVADLASANRASPLARSPRTNCKEPKLDTNTASALTALADCVQCQGRGVFYRPTAGRDCPCPCTQREKESA